MELENTANKKWRERFYRYAPFLVWTGVILYMSTSQASMSQTSLIIRPVLEYIFPNASEYSLVVYHSYIRKAAHFCEYSALGFFASRAFWNSSHQFIRNYWHIIVLGIVLVVASADELNQSFNMNRTGSITDVLLDGFGGLMMVIFLYGLKKGRNN